MTVYPKPSKDVQPIIERLQSADALVIVYPTWFNVPAILKGFFDRVFLPGVAFRQPHLEPEAAKELQLRDLGIVPNLTNIKKVACVTTYGSPPHIVFLAGDNGRNMIARAFVSLMAPSCTLTWLGLYDMDHQPLDARQDFIGKVRAAMESF
ncbi:NADPH dehydrogenase quinone 1 [Hondaea fermentalgiana]|uniref:NADPH dehydrogenase quinone 1 n=1 Tax=Hondaea fermentalgiana TaxID=2315210 RepID=A0A2R5G3V4_9STRA|nr:NADPH dehydrogenase quinone 1 [Hondaea fermentalgiana]|eukprot:GBG25225.1 NADPH dehydrogenase quinone 1 [Hondaea fermentalgiana]